jgi:uncharacterized protein YqcC (DUF446 family)
MSKMQDILLQIEQELKEVQLWQQAPVDPVSLQSQEPFCCDTLNFEQWLQFILIPKLHHMLVLGAKLPANASIAPMGEHLWQHDATKHKLIALLRQLDDCFNEA